MKIHEVITEETWCQMAVHEGNKYCIEGWVNHIYKDLSLDERFHIKLKLMMTAGCLILTQWNDEDGTRYLPDPRTGLRGDNIPKREFKDVLRILKKADV